MTAWTCEPRAPRALVPGCGSIDSQRPMGHRWRWEFAIVDEDDVLVLVVTEAELIPTGD